MRDGWTRPIAHRPRSPGRVRRGSPLRGQRPPSAPVREIAPAHPSRRRPGAAIGCRPCPPSRPDSASAPRPPPTRSRGRRTRTGAATRSGTPSAGSRASSRTATRATSPATTTTAGARTSTSWRSSAWRPTASRSRGPGCSPTAPGRSTRRACASTAARRGAARARDRAGRDALPLGSPAGPAGRRRVGQPRYRGALRRVRAAHGARARRPGGDLDHPQRAVGGRPSPATRRGASRPACATGRPRWPSATTCCCRTAWRRWRCPGASGSP